MLNAVQNFSFGPEIDEFARNTLNQLAAEALAVGGVKALLGTRWAAALHEAGHGVAFQATAGGTFLAPCRLRIKKQHTTAGPAWTGKTIVPRDAPRLCLDPVADPGTVRIQGLRLLAGVVSEMLFDADDFRMGSSLDEWVTAGMLAAAVADAAALDRGAVLAAWVGETRAILTANEPRILALAKVLERHGTIAGKSLRRHLVGIDPRLQQE